VILRQALEQARHVNIPSTPRSTIMQARTIQALAAPLRRAIGAHFRMSVSANWASAERFSELQAASQQAASLAAYLIAHLDNRHDAVRLAQALGMPGYINNR
jgi:hypothetical protein